MSFEVDEVISEFLIECHENLDRLDRDLVTLEQEPSDRATLAAVFRTIHTIKGTCGFLGFTKLESVTHVGESLLSRLRDGLLVLTPEITSALLSTVDAVREMLGYIERDSNEGNADYSELVGTLTRLLEPGRPAAGFPDAEATLISQSDGDPRYSTDVLVDRRHLKTVDRRTDSGDGGGSDPPPKAPRPRAQVSDSNIRVDVELLDKLMNLVGELVLARNQVLQFTTTQTDTTFIATSQRLDMVTSELQEGVMRTRMQPIGNMWSKLPRVVRDLAIACHKEVGLEMEGHHTELDKTIIEAIKDPLIHLVRNCVDHGIEEPAIRSAAGKPAAGRLTLEAFHEGGNVNIKLSDDGAGIDVERVRSKAIKRRIITAERAATMSERDLVSLVFLPGFSTAETVTSLSGRGVGMDVVKTNIEKIGGTIELSSTAGMGTTFRIKIPLTLAIIPALVVSCAGDRFAIPQVNLLELVRIGSDQVSAAVEYIHSAPVCRLRDKLLPLVYLQSELGLAQEPAADSGPLDDPGPLNIVVLQAEDRRFGLVVDSVSDTEEIVVKPLGAQLKRLSVYAGATIMGDGKVALILDAVGLAQHAGLISDLRGLADGETIPDAEKETSESQTLLLLAVGDDAHTAIALSSVARLEELPRQSVERAGNREVVQYRDRILPLIRLADVLGVPNGDDDPTSPLQVVVHTVGHRSVGLVVRQILDIVEEKVLLDTIDPKPGIVGSAVIGQRVTDILDVSAIITLFDPTFFAGDDSRPRLEAVGSR